MIKAKQARDFIVFLQIITIFATGLINEIIFALLFILSIFLCYIANSKAAKHGFDIQGNEVLYLWLIHRGICFILGFVGYGNLLVTTLAEQTRIILCLMTYKYYQSENGGFSLSFRKLIMLIFSFINVRSYIALLTNPALSRLLATGSTEAVGGVSTVLIGGYGYVYGLIFVVFALIISYKQKINDGLKLYRLILFITSVLYIIKASYTIALLLLIIGSLMSLFMLKSPLKSFFLYGAITLVFSLFINEILSFIYDMAVETNNSFYIEKAEELMHVFMGNSEVALDFTSRMRHYTLSFETFVEHPVFGIGPFYNGDSRLGYHATLIDNFARYGIFALISVFMITSHVKQQNAFSKHPARRQYFLIMCVILLILSLINTVHFAAVIVSACVIAPEMIARDGNPRTLQ